MKTEFWDLDLNNELLFLNPWARCTGALPCHCVYVCGWFFTLIQKELKLLGLKYKMTNFILILVECLRLDNLAK